MKTFFFVCIISFSTCSLSCMQNEESDDQEMYQVSELHQLADRYYTHAKLERLIISRVKAGKSIDVKNGHDETPFITALHLGNAQAAKLLLAGGCDITQKDREGTPALHLAAQAGDVDTVQTLIDKNVALDECDHGGNTPLHLVARPTKWFNKLYATVQLEISQGLCADLILRKAATASNKDDLLARLDSYKRTPLDCAYWNNWSVVAIFIKHGQKVHPNCLPFIVDEHARCVRLLHAEITRNTKETASTRF